MEMYYCCGNDVMNHFDSVIKRDVHPQKMHSCSKVIRGISVFVLKISVVYQTEYIMGIRVFEIRLFTKERCHGKGRLTESP